MGSELQCAGMARRTKLRNGGNGGRDGRNERRKKQRNEQLQDVLEKVRAVEVGLNCLQRKAEEQDVEEYVKCGQ